MEVISYLKKEWGKTIYCYQTWLSLPHEKVQSIRSGAVYKIFLQEKTYYLKLYLYPTYKDIFKILFRGGFIGKSRAQVEYKNLQYLYSKGISPQPLFIAEKRIFLFLQYSFLVMEEIPNSIRMDHFIFDKWHSLTKEQRYKFIHSLAIATKKMNEDGFVNGEYHWRNILVTENNGSYQFQIIDCCKKRIRDQLKPYLDIASLDIYAPEFFSEEERLFFLAQYLGVEKITNAHTKIIKRIFALKKKMYAKELRRYNLAKKKFFLRKEN